MEVAPERTVPTWLPSRDPNEVGTNVPGRRPKRREDPSNLSGLVSPSSGAEDYIPSAEETLTLLKM